MIPVYRPFLDHSVCPEESVIELPSRSNSLTVTVQEDTGGAGVFVGHFDIRFAGEVEEAGQRGAGQSNLGFRLGAR